MWGKVHILSDWPLLYIDFLIEPRVAMGEDLLWGRSSHRTNDCSLGGYISFSVYFNPNPAKIWSTTVLANTLSLFRLLWAEFN